MSSFSRKAEAEDIVSNGGAREHDSVEILLDRLTMRSLIIPDDISCVHGWVQRDYARFWGMQGLGVDQVADAYRDIIAPNDVEAHLGFYTDAPAFLLETYRPHCSVLVHHYESWASDQGMHLLVAPAERPIPGFTRAVFFFVMDFLFLDSETTRVVVEPDVRNEKIRALNLVAGFQEMAEIDLPATSTTPAKRAMLSICSREDYAVARRRGLRT